MKNRVLLVTGLCVGLCSSALAAEKSVVVRKEPAKKELTVADVLADSSTRIDANVRLVDRFKIMGESDEGQIARQHIEAKRDELTEEIQQESKKVEKATQEYVNKSTTMTDAAREKEEKRLMRMKRDVETLAMEKEEELKMDMQVATEGLVQSLEVAVAEYAQQEGVDIVFDKMTGQALYVSEKFDATDKIVQRVNENHKIKLAQNKKKQDAVKVADNKKVVTEKTIKS